jgi:hypothetical protein
MYCKASSPCFLTESHRYQPAANRLPCSPCFLTDPHRLPSGRFFLLSQPAANSLPLFPTSMLPVHDGVPASTNEHALMISMILSGLRVFTGGLSIFWSLKQSCRNGGWRLRVEVFILTSSELAVIVPRAIVHTHPHWTLDDLTLLDWTPLVFIAGWTLLIEVG